MAREALITEEGLEKLKTEIEHLSTTKRREVAGADQGGARVRRHLRELRVRRRQERAGPARAAHRPARGAAAPRERRRREGRSTPRRSASASIVHVKDQKSGDSRKFQIVGPTEADPAEHKLSHESPIGKALLGHKRGDIVTRRRPARAEEEAQDHEDRDRLAALTSGLGSPRWPSLKSRRLQSERSESHVLAERREKLERLRDDGRRAVPARVRRADRDRRPCGPRTRGSRPARRPRALPRRRADRRPPRPGQGRVHRPRRRQRAGSSSTRAPTCSASELVRAPASGSTSATSSASTGTAFETRRGELSLQVDRLDAAGQEPAPAARQVPRPRGHRAPLPPPRARPDRQPARRARLFRKRGATITAIREWLDSRGLRRGRDAGAAAALRRRAGAPVHHPPQRARPRPLPADRDRALPEAAASSAGSSASTSSARTSATRAISFKHNPEFTMLEWYEAYADYNDAAERLETWSPTSPSGSTGRRRSSATASRSTSRRRGGG